MDVFWLILALLLMVAGFIGCLLPFLPGPPLSYIGLLLMQLRSEPPFSTKFMLVFAAITIAVTVLDLVIPIYGTRKFGGTKYGVWGSTIGLVLGFLFPPWGIIIGPFVGAFLGELIANSNTDYALKAAIGSFVGFLFGTLLKLIVSGLMFYYLLKELIAG